MSGRRISFRHQPVQVESRPPLRLGTKVHRVLEHLQGCRVGFAVFLLQVLVHVVDQDNGGVRHGTDGDGDARQRHEFGLNPQEPHHQKREEDGDREGYHDDQGAPEMQKEEGGDEGRQDQGLHQGEGKVRPGLADEFGAVLGGNDLNSLRQSPLDLRDSRLDPIDDRQGVGSVAHDDDTGNHIAPIWELDSRIAVVTRPRLSPWKYAPEFSPAGMQRPR